MTWTVLFTVPWWSCPKERRNKNVQFQLYLWMEWSLKAFYTAIVLQTENLAIWNPRNVKASHIRLDFSNILECKVANFCDFIVDQQLRYAFFQSQPMTF